jgi:hypothetical protein
MDVERNWGILIMEFDSFERPKQTAEFIFSRLYAFLPCFWPPPCPLLRVGWGEAVVGAQSNGLRKNSPAIYRRAGQPGEKRLFDGTNRQFGLFLSKGNPV